MDKVDKALKKLVPKEKERIKNIIKTLQSGHFDNLDVKKLKGREDIFRIRSDNLRIIYQIKDNQFFILKLGYKKENTYKF